MKRLILASLALAAGLAFAQEPRAEMTVRQGAVIARGKWNATTGKKGDEPAFRHAVEIDCFRSDKTCMEATASVIGTDPDILVEYYDVLKWDENGIVAEKTSAICMTNQLNINFQEQSVLAIDAPKSGAKGFKDVCKSANHTQTYKLVGR